MIASGVCADIVNNRLFFADVWFDIVVNVLKPSEIVYLVRKMIYPYFGDFDL